VILRAAAVVAMARPSQLLLVLVVAFLGIALARARGAAPDPAEIAAGLGVLLLVAASIHLANEYADHETDARTRRTPFSGGSGTLPRTGLPRSLALGAALGCLGTGLLAAFGLLAAGLVPLPAVLILAGGAIGGWAYSVGPFPLAWRSLGEPANAVLGGLLLPLYGVAIAGGPVDHLAVAAFIPLALVVWANLLATTWPDRVADASVGKRTLATRWTASHLRGLYGLVSVGALLVLAAQSAGTVPLLVALAGITAGPFLVVGFLAYTRTESALPTVAAMSWLVTAQLAAWIATGVPA
jgi:1,4-dihydroxy-2-naphthoate polyprenyltransferase